MKKLALTVALSAVAAPALAHTGHGDANGFLHGLMHPVLGPDHLLAMLAVGLWSGFALPRRFWAGAATFLAAMTAGAGLSWAGLAVPGVELLIVGSVALFGLLVLLARSGQGPVVTRAALVMIAVFAACHGHAHATEATGSLAAYLGGFLIATAALHLVGIGLARALTRGAGAAPVRKALGAGIAGAGLFMMFG